MGIISIFVNPAKLTSNDFLLIAWNPGQELLKTGSIHPDYPYPLWTVVLMLPFLVLPLKTSMLLWFICNLVMLAASITLLISMLDWEITPALIALTVSLSGFFLPVLTSFSLGQLTLFLLLVLTLATYFFLNQNWTWLGITLGLSLMKPQIMFLLVGLILLWAFCQRRWRVLSGFAAILLILVLLSLPFVSNPQQFVGGGIGSHLNNYILRTSTIWSLLLNLGTSWLVPLTISLGMILWLIYAWLPLLRGRATSTNHTIFLFSVTVMINLIVLPYSWMYNLVLLLISYGYSASTILKMKGKARYAWLTLLLIVMYPITIGIFIVFKGYSGTQAYQIIPALFLLAIMIILEKKNQENINIESSTT